MRSYLIPFGDIVAWCLMPNHFHILFYVDNLSIIREDLWKHVDGLEYQRRLQKHPKNAIVVNRSSQRKADPKSEIKLNEAIGILQKTYTNALNKQKGMSGSLFRKKCKVEDGWINQFITLLRENGENYHFTPESGYAYNCFRYIHQNPVKARIVRKDTDYQWSSARDYAGIRNGNLCNLDIGRQLMENY